MRQVYKYGGAAAVAISHFANIENSIAQCRCNDGDFLIALLFSTHWKYIKIHSIRSVQRVEKVEIEREIKGKF